MPEFGKRPGARETLKRAGVLEADKPAEDSLSPAGPPEPPTPSAPATAGPEREFTVEARSQWKMVVRRFLRHRMAMISLAILVGCVVLAFGVAKVWPYSSSEVITADRSTSSAHFDENGKLVRGKALGGPSIHAPSPRCDGGKSSTVENGVTHSCAPHIFGTDDLGQDMFAQVMRGMQKSLQIAFVVALLATVIGVVVGAVAGYYRGYPDGVLMRIVDVLLTIPLIVVAGAMGRKVEGGQWWLLAVILAIFAWTGIARIIRGEFLSLREKEFVEAARAMGASDRRIIFKHMVPNVMGSIIVNATLVVALAILTETALSYLGLGVKYPDTSLGLLVSNYQDKFATRPWLFWFPGLFILLITLSINFIGDGLRDAFDPKQTRVRA